MRSGELNISNVADEHGGDGVSSELAANLECDWAAYYPQLRRFSAENSPAIPHPLRRQVVAVLGDQLARAPPLEKRRLHFEKM